MIINNDWFEYEKNIPDGSIDLAIVDPPYCIGYADWDNCDFVPFTEKWVETVVRKLKTNGSMWAFMGYQNLFTSSLCSKGLVNILEEHGIVHLENWVVWGRQKGRGASKHLKSSREDIIHFTKTKKFTWNPIKMLREVVVPYVKNGEPRGWFLDENGKRVRWTGLGNVWTYTAPFWKWNYDKQVHPSQKPKMLVDRLVRLSSNEGDTILDPFAGSCVVHKVCAENGRNSICIEKEIKYIE